MSQAVNESCSLPTITLIIPVYNERNNIERYFSRLAELSCNTNQLLIVEGESDDGTYEVLNNLLSKSQFANNIVLHQSGSGRARQMNYGAMKNTSDVIVFLHFDTALPANGIEMIRACVSEGALWGRFDVRLDDKRLIFRVIEKLMNWRSALTNIATGDQAVFIRKDIFNMIGGYPEIPLMEDIVISNRLQEISSATRITVPVITSARRWKKNGILRTIILMWTIRLAFWFGVSPERLAHWYRHDKNI